MKTGRPRLTWDDYTVLLNAYRARWGSTENNGPRGLPGDLGPPPLAEHFPVERENHFVQKKEHARLRRIHRILTQREAGRCTRCGGKPEPGLTSCRAHQGTQTRVQLARPSLPVAQELLASVSEDFASQAMRNFLARLRDSVDRRLNTMIEREAKALAPLGPEYPGTEVPEDEAAVEAGE